MKNRNNTPRIHWISQELSGESSKVPARDEVAVEDTWDLTPLYPDEQAWDADCKALGKDFQAVEKFRGCVAKDATTLLEALEFEANISQRVERLNQYAALRMSEDSSNPEALAREARLQSLLTNIAEAFSFLAPEMQAVDDDTFTGFLADPLLANWTIPLRKLRRRKPFTLGPSEERILALGGSVIAGHSDTFSQLTNVDMKFGKVRNDHGDERELTQSSFSSFLVQRKPEVRKEAFQQFYQGFSDHRFTLSSSLANSVRADVFYARVRNHPSALEAALFGDDVPPAVYDNLISAVRDQLPPLFRYLHLRKNALGLKELHHYDTYVPLVKEVKIRIPWDDAVEKVLAAVAPLGSEYVATLRDGLGKDRWCDRYENLGKRSGAFSYGTYQNPPYIMMNYKEDVFSDVYTMAHEAGHSMHSWFSGKTQSYQNHHYPIFLAEVASTFNEVLLTGHLLSETEDPKMRAYLINRQIDDFRGTLYRQTMFAEFEKNIHEVEEAGEPLTLETFRALYRKLLEAYFGDSMVIDSELELECLRIPHFYSAFYVYKYATGLAAAVALAEQVLKTGDASAYLNFLSSGGSKFPIEALGEAGVDMLSPAPVASALDLFARRVTELEELLG